MKLLLLLLAVSFPALAQVSLGVKTTKEPAFVLGDFTEDNLRVPDIFRISRYGFGRGQFEISERPSFLAENRSGFFLDNDPGLKVGFEPVAGYISYKGRPAYEWAPAVSVGPKVIVGPMAFYGGLRGGYSYSDTINDSITGWVASAQLGPIRSSYMINNYYNSRNRLEIEDLTVANRYNVQHQLSTSGEEFYYIGYKLDIE